MKINADQLGLLTVGGRDPRVTSIGYYLRKFKLDELPQLWNVLIGEMSLVGPRPEVRKYVEQYNDSQKNVLSIKPGITDWASILYKNENEILEKSLHPELDYVNIIMPDKIRYNFIFINNYTITEYFKILFETVYRLFIG
jgi:lipopolysaccharide/colanic/teichoic acid biosynthesis glycosyltransferase